MCLYTYIINSHLYIILLALILFYFCNFYILFNFLSQSHACWHSEAINIKMCKRKANHHVPTLPLPPCHQCSQAGMHSVGIGLLRQTCAHINTHWNQLAGSNEVDITLHFPLLIYHEYQMSISLKHSVVGFSWSFFLLISLQT